MPLISLVVAHTRNRVIGRAGGMPWHLPADLAHFKALTMGKPIVMGRRSFESIGRALPGRHNIVVTRDRGFSAPGVTVVHSFAAAIAAAGDAPELMVIGGGQLYREALALAGRIHLTEIAADIDGDTEFPALAASEWREVSRETRPADARNAYDLAFVVLERV